MRRRRTTGEKELERGEGWGRRLEEEGREKRRKKTEEKEDSRRRRLRRWKV